jgi:hypothetical protein
MTRLFPVIKKTTITGGAGGAPTVEWDDTVAATDNPAPHLTLPDTVGLADTFPTVNITPADTVGALDVARVDDTMTYVDTQGVKDVVRMTFEVTYDAAGQVTGGDAYTVEGAGNPGAATTTLLVSNNGAATIGRDGYIKFNLRNDTGGPLANLEAQTSPNNTITIALTIEHDDNLAAQTLTVTSLIQDADPWDEAAITFANVPAHNTAEGTISVAVGDFARYTHTLTSVMGTVLGNWLSLRFRDNTVAGLAVFSIISLEGSEALGRPVLSFKLKRGV